MGRFGAAALTALAAAVAVTRIDAQTKPASEQDVVFRSDVRLVRLLATVKDANGGLVGGLNKEDFRIVDSGVPQEVAVFERQTAQPLSISLLIDTSASTAKEIRYEIDSTRKFLKTLVGEGNPEDRAAMYSFNWQTLQLSGFTRRLARLEDALGKLKPEGGTSMYDAVTLAARDLEARDGRHVMIMVTDGGDTTSSTRFADAVRALQRADTVLYAILVVPITNGAGRNTGGENALATMTASTGGRVFTPSAASSVDSAFAEILRDLRTQYYLGYYAKGVPRSTDKFHRVETSVARDGLRVFTRTGYYGD